MKTLLIILTVILVLTGAVFAADLIPLLCRWFSRIRIGQWKNEAEWKSAVERSLLAQLKNPPVVPVSDNTRLTIIERLKGSYKSKYLQSWQEAALLLGANAIGQHGEAGKEAGDFIDSKINPVNGEWRNFVQKADSAMLAFAILSSPVSDKQKIKPAMDKTAEMLLNAVDRYGTVPYSAALPTIRFVDTLGLVCPFLFLYGLEYGCEKSIQTARRQIEEYINYGIHKNFQLPVHCFDVKSHAPLGIYGWGRGCGWLAAGLMDSYLSLTGSSAIQTGLNRDMMISVNEAGQFILNFMLTYADTLADYQTENGSWTRQVFFNETEESSATAMIAWFMGKMYVLTGNEQYKVSADKALHFLMKCTRRNGTVDYSQGDTKGIGFYSARLDIMPATQGFTVRNI